MDFQRTITHLISFFERSLSYLHANKERQERTWEAQFRGDSDGG